MKMSLIYIILAACIFVAVVFIPGLTGKASLKQGKDPADWLSEIILGNKDLNPEKTIYEPFDTIEILGNSHDLTLKINTKDSNKIRSNSVFNYDAEVKNKTLTIKTKNNDSYIALDINKPKMVISFNDTKVILEIGGLKTQKLTLIANEKTELFVSGRKEIVNATIGGSYVSNSIDSLYIQGQDKSTLTLTDIKSNIIKGQLSDAEMAYEPNIQTDSMIVNLQGKSVVRATDPHLQQMLGNLKITGDKIYFKNYSAGVQVNVIR